MDELKRKIIAASQTIGFDLIGVSQPKINNPEMFLDWIDAGYYGSMQYMRKNIDKRLDPKKLMPDVKSIICLGVSYYQPPIKIPEDTGRIAMYAWGADYHIILKRKLRLLADEIKSILNRNFRYRAFVDSAPVLETILAQQAGLGWIGKNSCLINKKFGSFFFLCELFVDFELPADSPAKNHCGKCQRCIDACPAKAIVRAGIVDARKCISYLTIEYRGQIGEAQAKTIGNWIFGCDVCQEVCPFNKKLFSTRTEEFRNHILGPYVKINDVLSWDENSYKEKTANSPAARASLEQWKRNARKLKI